MPNSPRKLKSLAPREQKLTPATLDEGSAGTGYQGSSPAPKPLPREFFNRDPRIVGRELLGKVLVRRHGRHILAGRIVETEAYLGVDDPAAHSAAGRTLRNAVLFGPPGYAYVYFIYGNHFCLNVSCLPDGSAGGVLFRALEPLIGLADMARFRHLDLSADSISANDLGSGFLNPKFRKSKNSKILKSLTSGPGRLAQAFAVTRLRDNGKDMTSPRKSDLYIVQDDFQPGRILRGPRVGITKAVEHPLRYMLANNPFISAKPT